jgi:zinc/manganese transport system permease protein
VTVLADVVGISEMLSHSFMRNAYLAGTAIAAASGLVGYFVVLRSQVFTGDALSHVAFTGALAALAFGFDARVGLFMAVIAIAVVMGALGDRGHADDVVIGTVFAWILGLGVLFLSVFTTHHATGNSTAGVSVLFGSIFGLDHDRTLVAVVIALVVSAAVVVLARPLLFASIDATIAAARGVPVRALGYAFLVLVGLAAAEATQAIGALLLLSLLAAPAATAQQLSDRPYRALAISMLIAIAGMWIGLALSYEIPKLPPSFAIVATLTAGYLAAALAGAIRRSRSSAAAATT